jgi:FkbH-like protein
MDAYHAHVAGGKPVKLVIWDLDHTLWDGILLENDTPALLAGLADVIIGLDRRGILQSVASRNDLMTAVAHLKRLGILDYFLAPQISWAAKSGAVATITAALNIGIDCVLFIDDQDFELAEVQHAHPEVRTLSAQYAANLLQEPLLQPPVVTQDAQRRRLMYVEDIARTQCEREFDGTPDDFLHTLELHLTLAEAAAADLDRAEELVTRTNQLNSTGILYSKSELHAFLGHSTHKLLMADLTDKFGAYGTVGVALLETDTDIWILKLLLVSCRVLSRGIGPILLSYLALRAGAAGKTLRVLFRDTGKNRAMKVALMMAGFNHRQSQGDCLLLSRDEHITYAPPPYVTITSNW